MRTRVKRASTAGTAPSKMPATHGDVHHKPLRQHNAICVRFQNLVILKTISRIAMLLTGPTVLKIPFIYRVFQDSNA